MTHPVAETYQHAASRNLEITSPFPLGQPEGLSCLWIIEVELVNSADTLLGPEKVGHRLHKLTDEMALFGCLSIDLIACFILLFWGLLATCSA